MITTIAVHNHPPKCAFFASHFCCFLFPILQIQLFHQIQCFLCAVDPFLGRLHRRRYARSHQFVCWVGMSNIHCSGMSLYHNKSSTWTNLIGLVRALRQATRKWPKWGKLGEDVVVEKIGHLKMRETFLCFVKNKNGKDEGGRESCWMRDFLGQLPPQSWGAWKIKIGEKKGNCGENERKYV